MSPLFHSKERGRGVRCRDGSAAARGAGFIWSGLGFGRFERGPSCVEPLVQPPQAPAASAAAFRSAASSEPRGSLAGRDIRPRETEYRGIPKACTEAKSCDPRDVLAAIRASSDGEPVAARREGAPKNSPKHKRRQHEKAQWLWSLRQPIKGTIKGRADCVGSADVSCHVLVFAFAAVEAAVERACGPRRRGLGDRKIRAAPDGRRRQSGRSRARSKARRRPSAGTRRAHAQRVGERRSALRRAGAAWDHDRLRRSPQSSHGGT
jgi:hypothetical protein